MKPTKPPKVTLGIRVERCDFDALQELQVRAREESLSAFGRRILSAYLAHVRRVNDSCKRPDRPSTLSQSMSSREHARL